MDVHTVNRAALPLVTGGLYLAVLGFLSVQGWRTFRGRPKRASLALILKMRGKNIRALSAKGEWRKVFRLRIFLLGLRFRRRGRATQ